MVARCHWSNDVNNQPLRLHNEGCSEGNTNSFASVLMEAFSVIWSKCCFGGFSNPPGKHLDQSLLFFIPQAITAASVTPYLLLMSRNVLL